ncbi:MAG: class I SAM-dependent methyltransferase [Conexivisphaerales archaeon]
MPKVKPVWKPEFLDIWNATLGFYKIWVIHLGRRYGILQALEETSYSPDELASTLGLQPEPIRIWCDVAYSLGLVQRKKGRYHLSKRLASILVNENDVNYIGGLVSYIALRSLDFGVFDDYFKNGASYMPQPHTTEAFEEATKWDHTAFMKLVLPREKRLRTVLENAKVLDLGSGAGNWSIKLASYFKNSTFVCIDPDATAIESGRKKSLELGLHNITFHVSKAEEMNFKNEFDVVYLGEVLCLINQRKEVLKACYSALKEGGFVVICEGLINVDKKKPDNQLTEAMQLDFKILGGMFLTKHELKELLSTALFTKIRFYDAGGGLWFAIAEAK